MGNIEKFGEFDGIQMGVMLDGTPFLTGRGLAFLCGVSPQAVFSWGQSINNDTPRWRKMSLLLREQDFPEDRIYEVLEDYPQKPNAYTEKVCLAFLEYYAFVASPENQTDKAKDIVRKLMGKTFRDFVYALVGYEREKQTFSEYTLSRIVHHHDVDDSPLPDGYFCLFDKMIEILQKFDLRIGYGLGERWYDTKHKKVRFLEPDISLGRHFSTLFVGDFKLVDSNYRNEYESRSNNSRIKNIWSKKLIDLKWRRDKAFAEQEIRYKYKDFFYFESAIAKPLLENEIDRKKYNFKPAPENSRPDNLDAFCYSNKYTELFYDWLRDVFFKYVWRDYILERDGKNWIKRYEQFNSLSQSKRKSILTTTEGNLIQGFEYRELWEKQLPFGN